jgi:hypothetical protein
MSPLGFLKQKLDATQGADWEGGKSQTTPFQTDI